MKIIDLYWLAGVLEGEGCFSRTGGKNRRKLPLICVAMTDLDVIERVRSFWKVCKFKRHTPSGRKEYYDIRMTGSRAAQWMMMLYPLMGERRKKRIKGLLLEWKSFKSNKARNADSHGRWKHV